MNAARLWFVRCVWIAAVAVQRVVCLAFVAGRRFVVFEQVLVVEGVFRLDRRDKRVGQPLRVFGLPLGSMFVLDAAFIHALMNGDLREPEFGARGQMFLKRGDVAGRLVFDRFVRDLVDLVAIARGASVDAERQLRSLRSEAGRRGVMLPLTFDVPDRALWEPGYAREAADSVLTDAHTLDEALAIVRPFVNPLLRGTASGRWNHERGGWTGWEQRAD